MTPFEEYRLWLLHTADLVKLRCFTPIEIAAIVKARKAQSRRGV